MERISLSAVMAALQIMILFGTEKNADLIFCLLNCLWSENTFLTADFGKTQSCWLLGDSILPSSSSCHLWLILGTNLFPSAFQASFLICFFKNISFFSREIPIISLVEKWAVSHLLGKVIVKGCIEPLLLFKNWHPPSNTHTHINITIVAADVAHLAPEVSHYSWQALMLRYSFALCHYGN